ncbi:unnamed protein product, partial [Clonostachys rhizophaga]
MLFQGYHQTTTTVRLKYLTEEQEEPFYLTLGTVVPHVRTGGDLAIAQVRASVRLSPRYGTSDKPETTTCIINHLRPTETT